MRITVGFVASVVFTFVVAFVVPYFCEVVFRVSDWIGGICWSSFPVKIFPAFWLLINQVWNILIFYVFGTLMVGIVCGALPATLTTELTRSLGLGRTGKIAFFLGVPVVAYGIFGYLMWQGIIPADQLWYRLHAAGPIRKVFIVLITWFSAMAPFIGINAEPEK